VATDKNSRPKSIKRQAVERFILAAIFILANLTGRINQSVLEGLASWAGWWSIFGLILFVISASAVLVLSTMTIERLFKAVTRNIFLMIANVYFSILVVAALFSTFQPLSQNIFGLNILLETMDTPALLLKGFVSSVLFTLLFRYEFQSTERLAFAKKLANTLAKNQKQLIETEEKQRTEASTFLHDRVQAQLMVLALEIANVEKNLGAEDAAALWRVRTKLENLRSVDLRRVGQMLTPNIKDFGLQHCLRHLIQQLEVADRVELRIDENLNRDAVQLQLGIYRIIEQALVNAITHGPASHIEIVAVLKNKSTYEVSISDNGPGALVSERTPGYGTAVIQSWVAILGAQKEIVSAPGQGYKLTATIPF
jgi:signal transduction histidine kinase